MDTQKKLDELVEDTIQELYRPRDLYGPKDQEYVYGYVVAYEPDPPHKGLGFGCFRILPVREEDYW